MAKVKTKSKKNGKAVESKKKTGKKAKAADRAAKKAARKGDGSFPDILVVTKEKASDESKYFLGHSGDDLSTLYKDGQTVAVYKLRRVSTVTINRKVAR